MRKRTNSWPGSHTFRRCVLAAAICAAALAAPDPAFSQQDPAPMSTAVPLDPSPSDRPTLEVAVRDAARVLEEQ